MSDNKLTKINNTPEDNDIVTLPNSEITSTEVMPAKETVVPHTPASVDQMEQIKQSIADNGGQVLAAMIQKLPVPVTRNINLGDFCDLFGLTYSPDKTVAGKLADMEAPMATWLKQFSFSYQNVYQAISHINTPANFSTQLAEVAETISSRQANDSFQKLFA